METFGKYMETFTWGNILVKRQVLFYDRIEFNASLRYADIAEDIAYLVMDLDYHKREDLRKYFI
jgi:hypothetical protein